METHEQLFNKLLKSIDDCENVLTNPTSTRKSLKEYSERVFANIQICNNAHKNFSENERKRFDIIYDRAMNIAGRATRFAALMKWEGA